MWNWTHFGSKDKDLHWFVFILPDIICIHILAQLSACLQLLSDGLLSRIQGFSRFHFIGILRWCPSCFWFKGLRWYNCWFNRRVIFLIWFKELMIFWLYLNSISIDILRSLFTKLMSINLLRVFGAVVYKIWHSAIRWMIRRLVYFQTWTSVSRDHPFVVITKRVRTILVRSVASRRRWPVQRDICHRRQDNTASVWVHYRC